MPDFFSTACRVSPLCAHVRKHGQQGYSSLVVHSYLMFNLVTRDSSFDAAQMSVEHGK